MNRPAALLALLALSGPLATQAAAPTLSGCPMFPAKNVWNTPVDTLAVHASSTTWVNTIGAANNLHPDFGTFYLGDPIGIPFVTVPGTQPPVAVTFDVPEESDPGPYPIPPDAPIEGGPASDGDRHVLVVNRDDCVLYETYYSFPNPDGSWDAFSGAVWDLKANLNRPDTWTSADAAGLPILPGLIRYGEFTAGEINHAIRFTAPQTRNQYVWPATHQASDLTGSQYPPMGARLRLKAAFDISGFDPRIQVILRALKKYGMILADNGSRWYLSGEHDPAWDDDLLGQLKTIAGSNFEAVETAPMRIATSSTKAFQPPPAVNLREVASGLTGPLDIANANDGSGRLFIVEKGGSIKILKNGSVLATPFFTRAVNTSGERGLLGLAFDPAFRTNRRFFVFYTPPDGSLQVSRYLAREDNPDLADMTTESTVINIPHPGQSNHNGGKLAFGPDGYLYVAAGDGGGSGDVPNNAQNLNVLLGKLLRLDVSGASGYAIPPTNPFVGVGGTRGEIWAYGLRNPWRFSFDRAGGDLWIGDVGQGTTEEVDFQPAGAAGGRNYGWRVFEGGGCFNPPSGCALPGHVPPVVTYGHALGNAITGGHVYRGRRSRALHGYYLYADSGSSRMWAVTREDGAFGNFEMVRTGGTLSGPTGFGEDEAGELYVTSFGNGRVFAIDGPAPGLAERRADLDANGNDDLVWKHTDGRAAVWLMNGLSPSSTGEILGPGTGWSPAKLADFDGDGATDIVWQNTNGAAAIWLMAGKVPTATSQIIGAGTGWSIVAAADLDADGKADLVWQHTDGRVAVWLMNGVTPTATAEILPAGTGFAVAKLADFDADGKRDIVFANPDGRVAIWLMNGTAVKASAEILPAATGWSVSKVADLDGDGRADIVWQHADGTVAAWLMSGLSVNAGAGILAAGTGWSVADTADFDGDGRTDLYWSHADGRAAIWLMNGLAPSATAQILNAGSGWSLARTGDLDGDGKADIVWQHTDGSVAVWLMNGTVMSSGAGILGPASGWSVSGAGE